MVPGTSSPSRARGTELMVRMLSVIFSPWVPSPRVAGLCEDAVDVCDGDCEPVDFEFECEVGRVDF